MMAAAVSQKNIILGNADFVQVCSSPLDFVTFFFLPCFRNLACIVAHRCIFFPIVIAFIFSRMAFAPICICFQWFVAFSLDFLLPLLLVSWLCFCFTYLNFCRIASVLVHHFIVLIEHFFGF